ncbi:hypothetical protein [Streptomyces sp. NBC_01244]|uniref:hypothetical protein n=1 Tax=Streptomyces sp. NBC_01244 TaxID=2903797 RepID=UPI002E149FC9|nr:hypothetical protein OG247_18435 [Streptomyces sp. NBC_01244]
MSGEAAITVPPPPTVPPPLTAADSTAAGFTATDSYLRAADEVGLLSRLDGLPLVAGEYLEPASRELQCLVEYAAPELLADAPRLLDTLFSRHPDCTAAVVRVPAHLAPHALLQPLLTYLRHVAEPPAPGARPSDAVDIRDAADTDRDAVGRWLSQAIRGACAGRGATVDELGTEDCVRGLLTAPDRRSYLVSAPGQVDPVGHATILTDAYDDVSGTGFVELVDILVEDGGLRRSATDRLVAACARTAAELGLPLIGHVSHPRDPDGADPAATIVAALCRKGWTPTHLYRYAARP